MTELNRYANGKIYMIESASAGLCYYGSTCMPLRKRLHAHKQSYHKHGDITSVIILDQPDYKIVLVEEFPCENKQQLHAREAYYIRNNQCVNKIMPNGRTDEENNIIRKYHEKRRYAENKEKFQKRCHQYYENNKEAVLNRKKKKVFCVCGSIISSSGKACHEKTAKHQLYISTL